MLIVKERHALIVIYIRHVSSGTLVISAGWWFSLTGCIRGDVKGLANTFSGDRFAGGPTSMDLWQGDDLDIWGDNQELS